MENTIRKLIPQIIGILIVFTASILSLGYFFSLAAGLSLVLLAFDKKSPMNIRLSSTVLGGFFIASIIIFCLVNWAPPVSMLVKQFGISLPYSSIGGDLGLW